MLISTTSSLFLAPPDVSKPPKTLIENLDIRRVQKGDKRNLIALSDGSIIIQERDSQKTLQTGIVDRIDSILIVEEDPLVLLIGCTPPNLYKLVEETGETRPVHSFQKLSVRDQWYTPWGGPPAVRSMDITNDGWVYADIHVGSIMRSPDKGETWEPVNPTLHKDVHQVITCPSKPERVIANTYLSVYVSDDGGGTWSHRSDELNQRYGRGVAVHPTNPDIILCGVSDGPSGSNVHGQLFRTENAGKKWKHIKQGFPESTLKNIDTFHIQFIDDHAFVSDENRLYHSKDVGQTWAIYWTAPGEIAVISTN
jgi:alkylated DNA repair dioxygenase AlkB